jgi:hypothetical protein
MFSIAAYQLKLLSTLHKKIKIMCVIPQPNKKRVQRCYLQGVHTTVISCCQYETAWPENSHTIETHKLFEPEGAIN